MSRKRKKYWIQKAIKKEGALTRWLKRNERKIIGAIGRSPFNKDGTVSLTALKKLRKTRFYKGLSTTTKRRINLAITLIEMAKKRK